MFYIEYISLFFKCMQVRINFLIIGHTHNDVDQIFSKLAEALRRLVAITLDGKYREQVPWHVYMFATISLSTEVHSCNLQNDHTFYQFWLVWR